MSTEPSKDPIRYRKELGKNMGREDQDSSTDDQNYSSNERD